MINPIWSSCIILLFIVSLWLAFILLRNFISVFMRDIGSVGFLILFLALVLGWHCTYIECIPSLLFLNTFQGNTITSLHVEWCGPGVSLWETLKLFNLFDWWNSSHFPFSFQSLNLSILGISSYKFCKFVCGTKNALI